MKKIKLILSLAIIFIVTVIPITIFASNENIQILVQDKDNYLIYIKGHENSEFQFGFSNDLKVEPAIYLNSEKDSGEARASSIAYINKPIYDKYFNSGNPVYFWAKINQEYIVKGIEINLNNSITKDQISYIKSLTKRTDVQITTKTEEKNVDGIKISTTTGRVVLPEGNYKYKLFKANDNLKYKEIISLAERISKMSFSGDSYKELTTYKEFLGKLDDITGNIDWEDVQNSEIIQPKDAEKGDQYLLVLMDENENIDIQILTSVKEYSEEKITELVTTRLPVTYDNNTLLIIFGITVLAIIGVAARMLVLKKKVGK